MKYTVTVVSVTYNSLTNLKKTASNVLCQQFSGFEYLIVDGASTDGTAAYMEQLAQSDPRVRYVSEKDNGIFDAMNKGVRLAEGEWIIFMNAGDVFADDAVMHNLFEGKNYEEDIIYGDVVIDGKVKPSCPPKNCHRMYFCHQSSFARRSLLQAIPFDTNHRYSADIKFVKQAYLQGFKLEYVPMPIADYDMTGVSNTNRAKALLDNMKVVRECDSFGDQLKFLPHLIVPYLTCRLKHK